MKKYGIFAAVILLSSLFALAAFLLEDRNFSVQKLTKDAVPFWKAEDAAVVEISWMDRHVTLEKKSGRWLLKERNYAQAATKEVAVTLQHLASIRPLKEVYFQGEDELRVLNLLDKPFPGTRNSGVGVSLKVRDGSGKVLLDMILGKGHVRMDPERIGQYRLQSYDGRYVLIRNHGASSRAYLIGRVFEKCHPTPGFWVDPLILRDLTDRPMYFRYSKRNGSGVFETCWWASATASGFVMTHPLKTTLSLPKLQEKLSALASPFSLDLAPETVVLPPAVFTERFQAVMQDGRSYVLELARQESVTYGKMQVFYSPEKTKSLPGETAAEFGTRKMKLSARTEFEKQSWEGRVFLLKNDLQDVLSRVPAK